MDLAHLYDHRVALSRYPERLFKALSLNVDAQNPVIFVADARATAEAAYFNLSKTDDAGGYTIYVVTCENIVLFYVIDVKTVHCKLYANGLVLKTRKRWDDASDRVGVAVRYQFADFEVISNRNATATVFARNVTADPKT